MAFPKKPLFKKTVYLDHAATTPVDPRVLRDMMPFFSSAFANPSALYSQGRTVRAAVEQARQSIADFFSTQPDTIVFTSGGTESNNMALFGILKEAKKTKNRPHIITSKIEHHSILNVCKKLEEEGVEVTYVDVDENGTVNLNQIEKSLKKETVLVSVMFANNEIGTIQPIADIGRLVLKWRKKQKTNYPYIHTDACQAAGVGDLHVEKLHVDLLSMNGGKIYGPKGTGILYVRRGVELEPLLVGGGQEFHKRSGTEHVPGIIGFASALSHIQEKTQIRAVRDYFYKRIQDDVKDVELYGPDLEENRLENNLNISFDGVEAESLVVYLDAYGISVGTGSACAAGNDEGSHVLDAIGKKKQSIRFTLGRQTTKKDIDYVMKFLPDIVSELRSMNRIR